MQFNMEAQVGLDTPHSEAIFGLTGLAAGSRLDYTVKTNASSSGLESSYIILYSGQQISDYFGRLKQETQSVVCGSPSLFREPLQKNGNSFSFSIRETGQYALWFASCSTSPTTVAIIVEIEGFYLNPDAAGRLYQHLPLEELPNASILSCLAFLYTLCGGAWMRACLRHRPFVTPIHVLVGVVLAGQAMSTLVSSLWYGSFNRQ